LALSKDRLRRLERLRAPEPNGYRVDEYEDEAEVRAWFEELLNEFGFADATDEERSAFLDRFVNGAPGEVLSTPPDHRADA